MRFFLSMDHSIQMPLSSLDARRNSTQQHLPQHARTARRRCREDPLNPGSAGGASSEAFAFVLDFHT
jgi:hypothetical protein